VALGVPEVTVVMKTNVEEFLVYQRSAVTHHVFVCLTTIFQLQQEWVLKKEE